MLPLEEVDGLVDLVEKMGQADWDHLTGAKSLEEVGSEHCSKADTGIFLSVCAGFPPDTMGGGFGRGGFPGRRPFRGMRYNLEFLYFTLISRLCYPSAGEAEEVPEDKFSVTMI